MHNRPVIVYHSCRYISMNAQLLRKPKSCFHSLNPCTEQGMQNGSLKQQQQQKHEYDAVLQFGWNVALEFAKLSLRGAVYVDCIEIQQPTKWLLRVESAIRDALNSILAKHGSKESQGRRKHILVYNRNVQKLSMIPACRLGLVLLHLGMCEVIDILVDGLEGFTALTTKELTIIRLTRDQQFKIIWNLKDIENRDQNVQLVDVRTRGQFDGHCSGYSYHNKKGRIEGALYHGGNQSKSVNEAKEYELDGKFMNMWKSNGICLERPVVVYCGTGWRASQVMVLAALHGARRTSLYSNGWVEWSIAKNS